MSPLSAKARTALTSGLVRYAMVARDVQQLWSALLSRSNYGRCSRGGRVFAVWAACFRGYGHSLGGSVIHRWFPRRCSRIGSARRGGTAMSNASLVGLQARQFICSAPRDEA